MALKVLKDLKCLQTDTAICAAKSTGQIIVFTAPDCCHDDDREQKLHNRSHIPIKAETCYLEHVCIAVVGVLHHHHLDTGQSVRDAVLVFVADGLKGHRGEEIDEPRGGRKEEENQIRCVDKVCKHTLFT